MSPHELGFLRRRAGGPEVPVAVEFSHRRRDAQLAAQVAAGAMPIGIPAALAQSQGVVEGALVTVACAGVTLNGAATILPAPATYVALPLEAVEALLAAGLGFRIWDSAAEG